MEIERDIIGKLHDWKISPSRKPLLLWGARQVGKSWALRKFGSSQYEYCVYLNFDNNPELCQIFESNHNIERIIKELRLLVDVPIEKGKTLLVFDEIQECEAAFNSLKYFHEDAPDYHVAAAGSLLGVTVKKKNMKVPVGQVDVLRVYPITFREFLRACDIKLYSYVEAFDFLSPLSEIILNRLITEYRRYLVCGGMPEAVKAILSESGSIGEVDTVLNNILGLYELDFAKYASPTEVNRIKYLWKSLPSQLAKENKKFLYRAVRTGARAREYEDALLWLIDAGLIYQVYNVSTPKIPLSAYADLTAFKVYACDCGILRRLSGLSAQVVLSGNAGYVEFRGALAENAVLQSIISNNGELPFYWTSEGRAEVDFLLQHDSDITPIEVKSETKVSGKSLAVYNTKYLPKWRIRTSMNNFKVNDGLIAIPLPLMDWLPKIMNSHATSTPLR